MVWQFLKKLNIRLVYSTTVPLLGMYSKELKAQPWTDICLPMFISSTIHNRYKMETTQMFINKWMNTQNIVHTYHEISFSLKKEFNSDTWYNMDKPWKHCARWHNPDIICFHLYEALGVVKFIKRSRMVMVVKGWE